MCQVTLACRLRCWEDPALFQPGKEESARRVFYAMERKLRKGRWKAAGKYVSFVMNDWFCDLFLSIRIMFLACMVGPPCPPPCPISALSISSRCVCLMWSAVVRRIELCDCWAFCVGLGTRRQ